MPAVASFVKGKNFKRWSSILLLVNALHRSNKQATANSRAADGNSSYIARIRSTLKGSREPRAIRPSSVLESHADSQDDGSDRVNDTLPFDNKNSVKLNINTRSESHRDDLELRIAQPVHVEPDSSQQ